MTAPLKIGEVARWVGLPEKTIRYYEDVGLISPPRSENGFRYFDLGDIQALTIIKGARALGFSVEESRSLLALAGNRDRSSADVKAMASAQLEKTRDKIAQLKKLENQLEILTRACHGDNQPDCPILNYISKIH